MRPLLALHRRRQGCGVVHLLSTEESGPIGPIFTGALEPKSTVPSSLIYAVNRDIIWQDVSGEQTSRLVSTGVTCPPSPVGSPTFRPAASCVQAAFMFGFANVRAEPFPLRVGPGGPPPKISGSRTLSMAARAASGVKLKVTLVTFAVPPTASEAIP